MHDKFYTQFETMIN